MNVLSDILCDTSSLLPSSNYKGTSSENRIMSSQEIFARQGSLNLLDCTAHISTIERPIIPVNSHSSPNSINLFNSSDQVHIPQNVDTDFEGRSDSVFSDSFTEIVPSWLTHDFMKASENLSSPDILSNVSNMYPTTQEDEQLEMLDLGFTSDLTSDLTTDLNRNCITNGQKLLHDLPIQQYSNLQPIMLSSLNDINVPQMHVPVKNIPFQKFKPSVQINKSSNLINTVLNCNNELVQLSIPSDLTSQCLTVNSSPALLPNSQSHNSINSVCDKLPHINLNNLNSFLDNDISGIQLLHQNFPNFNLPDGHISNSNNGLNNCQPNIMNISSNSALLLNSKEVPLKTTQDISIQVSRSNSTVENCTACSKVKLDAAIEEIFCFKCKLCDFISIHKCDVQNHSASHSKPITVPNSSFDNRLNINQASPIASTSHNNYLISKGIISSTTMVPINSHLNSSIIENAYTESDNLVISKSNFVSVESINCTSSAVQLNAREEMPISYQIITSSEGDLNSTSNNEINCHKKNSIQDLVDQIGKHRPTSEKSHTEEGSSESKKKKASKQDTKFDKYSSGKKIGWQKKIKRELGSYICEFKGCNIRFKALDNLDYHRKCHVSGGNTFSCPECGMLFNTWASTSGHLWRTHSNDMELQACDKCSFKTYSLSRLENYHKKTHLDECPFVCDICDKKFKNRKQLRNHKVVHNKIRRKKIPKPQTCKICLSIFSTKYLLSTHQELVHNLTHKRHSCTYCDYTSKRRSTMNLHMRSHTGEKPFQCDECEYKTSDHNSLRRHKMIHADEKGYHCPYCSYTSRQSNTYKDHLHRKHPGQNLVYSCKTCSYRSINIKSFRTHMEEHECVNKYKQLNQRLEIISNEEMLPLIEAMGIRLSNGDSLGYLNNGVNN